MIVVIIHFSPEKLRNEKVLVEVYSKRKQLEAKLAAGMCLSTCTNIHSCFQEQAFSQTIVCYIEYWKSREKNLLDKSEWHNFSLFNVSISPNSTVSAKHSTTSERNDKLREAMKVAEQKVAQTQAQVKM